MAPPRQLPRRLTDVAVPASGTVGQPVRFSAQADDSWSGVAGYDWAFGDGAGATGAAVEHVYAGAGRFPVFVTARDGAGNATQSAASPVDVTATPPAPPPVPGPAPDRVAPVVSGLALDRACLNAPVSAVTARFTLSENARVLYAIRRWRKAASRTHCPHHRYRKRPDATQPVDVRSSEGRSGENVATLARAAHSRSVARGRRTVRLAIKGLRPGTYQLLVRATDVAGNRSTDRIVRFWVLRR